MASKQRDRRNDGVINAVQNFIYTCLATWKEYRSGGTAEEIEVFVTAMSDLSIFNAVLSLCRCTVRVDAISELLDIDEELDNNDVFRSLVQPDDIINPYPISVSRKVDNGAGLSHSDIHIMSTRGSLYQT